MNTEHPTTGPADGQPPAEPTPVERYEIRISGRLSSRWASWFDGLTLINEDDGTTVISGPVVDQAALHGLLQKLRDLGITLLSVTSLPTPTAITHPQNPRTDAHASHPSPGATS